MINYKVWSTVHIEDERKMIHHFDNGYKVTVDFSTNKLIKEFGDKHTIDSIEDMSLEEYTNLLIKISCE